MDFSKFLKFSLLWFFVFLLGDTATARETSQKLFVLHDAVGPTIDYQENERFGLFSQNIGLIAAKIYHSPPDKWRLHLLGEKDGTSWMLIQKWNPNQNQALRNRIEEVMGKEKAGESRSFALPVYPITLPAEYTSEQPLKIELIDNTEFYGRISACSSDTVVFLTLRGIRIEIPENQILEAEWPLGKVADGRFLRYDPAHHRLFFGATGRTLQKGAVNFSAFYVLFPLISVGVSDMFMLGGGISLVGPLFYVTPKVRLLHKEKLDWSVGMLFLGVPSEEVIGIGYTALSIGSPHGGVTLGAATQLFVAQEHGGDGLEGIGILFGGEIQVSNHVKLLSENWLFSGGDVQDGRVVLLSGGLRFSGTRFTADLAVATFLDNLSECDSCSHEESVIFVPYVGFSVNFGK